MEKLRLGDEKEALDLLFSMRERSDHYTVSLFYIDFVSLYRIEILEISVYHFIRI